MIRRYSRRILADVAVVVVSALDLAYVVELGPLAIGLALVTVAALLVRRRYPYVVFVFAVATAAATLAMAPLLIAVYQIAVRTRNWALLAGSAAVVGAAFNGVIAGVWDGAMVFAGVWDTEAVVGMILDQPDWRDRMVWLGQGVAVGCAPVFLGRLVRAHRDLSQRIVEINEARAHERELVAQQALARERAHLAREMHDVVSHQVSLISVRAGALQVSAADAKTVEAAATIRELSVATLNELRHMVAVLRAAGGRPTEIVPQPTLDGLGGLIESSGIETTIDSSGLPSGLDTAAQRAVYRTVQEALTNIRKHAPGAAAAIRITGDGDWLLVSVTNTAPAQPGMPLPSARNGLVGLRERAALLGGTLTAGPTHDAGYRVELRLPLGAR